MANINLPSEALMNAGFQPIPQLDELHPEAHISLQVLNSLAAATYVEDPNNPDWMQPMVNNDKPIDINQLPAEFRSFYNSFDIAERAEIVSCLSVMTLIANKYNYLAPQVSAEEMRYVYQAHELYIMNLVKNKVSQLLTAPAEERLLWISLQGAGIFQDMYSDTVCQVDAVEVKRLRMPKNYGVGFGPQLMDMLLRSAAEKDIITSVNLPDDCISTGMTQGEALAAIFRIGFLPQEIIIPVTVATAGGINHLVRIKEELQLQYAAELTAKYGHANLNLIIAAANLCQSVNEKMYLTMLGSQSMLVGDMGVLAAPTSYGTPFSSYLPNSRIIKEIIPILDTEHKLPWQDLVGMVYAGGR